MMKTLIGILSSVLILILPIDALACACCAERGHRSEQKIEFKDYLRSEVELLSLRTARLYTDAGYPENIKGIDTESDQFSVSGSFSKDYWTFSLVDEAKKAGMLNLSVPEKVRMFMVDPEPNKERPGVLLYKEMSFTGSVKSASGFAKKGESKDLKYELVLQGKGNICTAAQQFSSYFLTISGANADYKFYGKIGINEGIVFQKRGDENGKSTVRIPVADQR